MLKVSLQSYDSTLRYALTANAVEKAKAQTMQFFNQFQEHLISATGWSFGGSSATALDAYLVPFIARLTEAENGDLVPPKLQEYAQWAMDRPEWQSVMRGKPTLFSVYNRDYLIPWAREGKRVNPFE
jgi:glutathione S-transferase